MKSTYALAELHAAPGALPPVARLPTAGPDGQKLDSSAKAAEVPTATDKAAAPKTAQEMSTVAPPEGSPALASDVRPAAIGEAAVSSDAVSSGATPPAWRKPVQWGALGLGSAGVVTGAVCAGLAVSAKSGLNAKKLPDGRYDEAQITVADANATIKGINAKWAAAGVAGIVGLSALSVAIWLAVTEPKAHVTLAPLGSGNGLALVGVF